MLRRNQLYAKRANTNSQKSRKSTDRTSAQHLSSQHFFSQFQYFEAAALRLADAHRLRAWSSPGRPMPNATSPRIDQRLQELAFQSSNHKSTCDSNCLTALHTILLNCTFRRYKSPLLPNASPFLLISASIYAPRLRALFSPPTVNAIKGGETHWRCQIRLTTSSKRLQQKWDRISAGHVLVP